MSFEIEGKTHTLQGIKDECPQVINKSLEVIWSYHEEEEEKNNVMLGLREVWHDTYIEEGAQYLKLYIQEVWHPMLDKKRAWNSTLGIREA